MTLRQRWKQTTIANKLMVWTTTIVAAGTLFYAAVAVFQYRLMKEGARQASEQTDKLIAASQRIAESTVAAVNEAKRANEEIANRAKELAEANKSLAQSGKTSASAAQRSADLAKEAIVTGNRAYVSVGNLVLITFKADSRIVHDLYLWNSGNSPTKVTGQAWTGVSDFPRWMHAEMTGPPNISAVVPPRGVRRVRLTLPGLPTAAQVKNVKEKTAFEPGKQYLVTFGRLSYRTLGETVTLSFCAYYIPDLNDFFDCEPDK